MAFDAGILNGIKTLADYQQLEQAFRARQQEAQAQQLLVASKLANGGTDKPSSVAEYEYFRGLPPEGQQQYLAVKRSAQIQNLGNQFGAFNPLTGQTQAIPGSAIAVSPDQNPALKGAQALATNSASNASDLAYAAPIAQAKETGKVAGETAAGVQKAGQQATGALDLITQARDLLPQATSGRGENVWSATNQLVGRSTPTTQADSQLDIISAGLTRNVPRFEGPQSNIDVQSYKEAAGDIGNRNKSIGDRLAALKEIERLNLKAQQKAGIPAVNMGQSVPTGGSVKPPALPTGQTVSLAEVEASARRKGIPVEQAIQHLLQKGVNVE